jgi:hypothetical protein
MPQPVPTPLVDELITVAEICLVTYDEAVVMVAADSQQEVSNAKWAATLEDLALWPALRFETGDVKKVGSIEFFEEAASSGRLDFRNSIRARYNQPLLTSETSETTSSGSSLASAGISSQQWF